METAFATWSDSCGFMPAAGAWLCKELANMLIMVTMMLGEYSLGP